MQNFIGLAQDAAKSYMSDGSKPHTEQKPANDGHFDASDVMSMFNSKQVVNEANNKHPEESSSMFAQASESFSANSLKELS